MICGSLAGIISKTGVFPLDVVRKRLQVQGPHLMEYVVSTIPSYAQQNTVIGCMRKIVYTEGVLGLYKGIVLAKDGITNLKESGFQVVPEKSVFNV